jgi:hypothetical protein
MADTTEGAAPGVNVATGIVGNAPSAFGAVYAGFVMPVKIVIVRGMPLIAELASFIADAALDTSVAVRAVASAIKEATDMIRPF